MKQRSLVNSFNYAIEGIFYVLRTQKNMRTHFIVAFFVLFLSLFLKVGKIEFILLAISISMVLVAELINTAIESAIDITTTTFDPLAKIAKDVAAAAVLITALNAVVVGVIIFYGKLGNFTVSLVSHIRSMSIYITIVSIFIVMMLVVVAKTFRGKRNFLKGGWVSGHAALAFTLFSALVFITWGNPTVAILGFIMALLVCQTRYEAKVHTILEIFTGAALGFLVTTLIFQFFYGF